MSDDHSSVPPRKQYGSAEFRKKLPTTIPGVKFSAVPAGEYEVEIIKAEIYDRNPNKESWKLTLKITAGEYAGNGIWHDLWLTEDAVAHTKADLSRLGIDADDPEVLDAAIESASVVGLHLRATLSVQSRKNGDKFNRVDSFFKIFPAETPPQAAPPTYPATPPFTPGQPNPAPGGYLPSPTNTAPGPPTNAGYPPQTFAPTPAPPNPHRAYPAPSQPTQYPPPGRQPPWPYQPTSPPPIEPPLPGQHLGLVFSDGDQTPTGTPTIDALRRRSNGEREAWDGVPYPATDPEEWDRIERGEKLSPAEASEVEARYVRE